MLASQFENLRCRLAYFFYINSCMWFLTDWIYYKKYLFNLNASCYFYCFHKTNSTKRNSKLRSTLRITHKSINAHASNFYAHMLITVCKDGSCRALLWISNFCVSGKVYRFNCINSIYCMENNIIYFLKFIVMSVKW